MFGLATMVQSQVADNWRVQTLWIEQDSTTLDTLSIVPETFSLKQAETPVDTTLYTLFPLRSLLVYRGELPDSLEMSYQVFPLNFNESFSRRDTSIIINDPGDFTPYEINQPASTYSYSSNDGLNKTGSITRGIAVGNNQDLSVNSSFQLDLSGKLTDEIQVLASVSDDNIPIQPDGNTAQLQDFDNVFIQLFDDRRKLTVGDYNLNGLDDYFLRYRKRVKGANFTVTQQLDSISTLDVAVSAAVSKGKFARNLIQGVEGVQGPYRLNGSEGETFIIVLSGTEKVYIDGILLKRGQEFDYVINYNSSEIIFTPNQPITKDRRIIVEFQYSDKNYARSLLQTRVDYTRPNSKYFISAYGEQDSKNQPLQQDIDDDEILAMIAAGDDLLAAATQGIDSVAYSDDLILYQQVDTLGYDSVFVFSTNPELARFRVFFSFVGAGNGDYIESDFTANGRVYEWIAPDTLDGQIIHNGDFAPLRILTTPKKRQMISAGAQWKLGRAQIDVEGALSIRDLNTFSALDSDDDLGYGGKVGLSRTRSASDSSWQVLPGLKFEYTSQDFSAIERFRAVEFERNWNILGLDAGLGLVNAGAGVELYQKGTGTLLIEAETLDYADTLTGQKALLTTDLKRSGWFITSIGSFLSTDGALNSQFVRNKSHLGKKWKYLSIGYQDEFEDNQRFAADNDTLITGSYGFYDGKVYLAQGDSSRHSFELYFRQRSDRGFTGGQLINAAVADQYGGNVKFRFSSNHTLGLNVSNRQLNVIREDIITTEPENTLLGRIDHNLRAFRGAVSTNTYYEVGSGLEQQREFVYIQVQPGQGTYVWNDYNGDGVKDLEEFEVAQFAYEADYIRTFIPSADYARTYTNAFNQTVQLNPAAVWNGKSGVKKAIARFTSSTSIRIDRKTTFEDDANRFNPFALEVADTALLSLGSNLRQTIFFNRSNTTFGVNYTFQDSRNKSLLTSGFESRDIAFHEVNIRLNVLNGLTWLTDARVGTKNNQSDFLESRTYALDEQSLKTEIVWQPTPVWRAAGMAGYSEKTNSPLLGGEQSDSFSLGANAKFSDIKKGSAEARLELIQINYTGESNNALSFEMLEGLNPGTNFTWNLTIQRKLAKNLQLNLIYNGRKSEDNAAIHSGGAQVRAMF